MEERYVVDSRIQITPFFLGFLVGVDGHVPKGELEN
jgi:hypothetical protein